MIGGGGEKVTLKIVALGRPLERLGRPETLAKKGKMTATARRLGDPTILCSAVMVPLLSEEIAPR
jgi:hypothetical protein